MLVTVETVSVAEAKTHLPALVARVNRQHERIHLTVHGMPAAVLVAPMDLESLEETIEVLADADAMRRLHASNAEVVRGETETQGDLDAAMRRRRDRDA